MSLLSERRFYDFASYIPSCGGRSRNGYARKVNNLRRRVPRFCEAQRTDRGTSYRIETDGPVLSGQCRARPIGERVLEVQRNGYGVATAVAEPASAVPVEDDKIGYGFHDSRR